MTDLDLRRWTPAGTPVFDAPGYPHDLGRSEQFFFNPFTWADRCDEADSIAGELRWLAVVNGSAFLLAVLGPAPVPIRTAPAITSDMNRDIPIRL